MTTFHWKQEMVPTEGLQERQTVEIEAVVVHRIAVSVEDPSFGDTPAEIARFFRDHPIGQKATGGDMPYPILIEADGTVTQTLPLRYVAPHAKSHNRRGVGVGVVGDFRSQQPSPLQYEALIAVLQQLLGQFGLRAESICAHDALAGGTSDPDKICPGKGISIAELRREMTQRGIVHSSPFTW